MHKQSITSKCPICQKIVEEVLNLGIYYCSMRINGQIAVSKQMFTKVYEIRNDQGFLTFQDKDETKRKWSYLEFQVKKWGWYWDDI